MNIERAFDSLDHSFLISVFLKKLNLGKISLIGSKYCYISKNRVLKDAFTTKYFNLEKAGRQGYPISAYLFIRALEIIFLLIKNDSSMKGIKVFDYIFL